MKKIVISDTTLCREGSGFGFKEKIEIARLLSRLCVDVIELPAIENIKTDTLLVRTVSSLVKNSILSVGAGKDAESIRQAAEALGTAAHPRIRIELSVSPVGMEYTYHKKPQKMLAWITEAVTSAKAACPDVEFCAMDATRAEEGFLEQAIHAAVAAGATALSVCDSAGQMLPDDFAAFAERVAAMAGIPVGVLCDDQNGLSAAAAVLAVRREGIATVKTSVGGAGAPLEGFAGMIRHCGENYRLSTGLKCTELHRTARQIGRIVENIGNRGVISNSAAGENTVLLDAADDRETVLSAVQKLGYDLSEEDADRVYEEFLRLSAKKRVDGRDLEAIVASVAMQVPETYKLKAYVINNGNIISSSAQITLTKGDREMSGICMGDGPINAAFLALEQIIGHHYELDDFQIQTVTEGTDAMGAALVKLRSGGKLYSGKGISTDILCAGIRAYINAVNKIVYEEAAQ